MTTRTLTIFAALILVLAITTNSATAQTIQKGQVKIKLEPYVEGLPNGCVMLQSGMIRKSSGGYGYFEGYVIFRCIDAPEKYRLLRGIQSENQVDLQEVQVSQKDNGTEIELHVSASEGYYLYKKK